MTPTDNDLDSLDQRAVEVARSAATAAAATDPYVQATPHRVRITSQIADEILVVLGVIEALATPGARTLAGGCRRFPGAVAQMTPAQSIAVFHEIARDRASSTIDTEYANSGSTRVAAAHRLAAVVVDALLREHLLAVTHEQIAGDLLGTAPDHPGLARQAGDALNAPDAPGLPSRLLPLARPGGTPEQALTAVHNLLTTFLRRDL